MNIEFRLFFFEKIKESLEKTLKQEDENYNSDDTISESDKMVDESDCGILFEIDLNDSDVENPKSLADNNKNKNDTENENKSTDDKKEKEEKPKDFIDELFSGVFMQSISGEEPDGSSVESNTESTFTEIILDLSNANDIYQSLDSYTELIEISDFLTPKGNTINANKIISLKEIPPIISFLIQRVDYDAEKNIAVKNHSRFDFPMTLYLDRYKTENMQKTLTRRKELENLQAKKAHFEAMLNNLSSFHDTNVSVQQLLETSLAFVESKMKEEQQLHNNDEEIASLQNENSPLHSENKNSYFSNTINTLQESLQTIKNQEKEYLNHIKDIDEKISSLYLDMNTIGYRLHSTLVHSGLQPGGGHYWAYSYDIDNDKWYKYNDTHVSEVSEETVFSESRGGQGCESAYCLTYVHPSIHTGPPKPEDACQFIHPELQVEIATDNEEHESEIERWAAGERPSVNIINNNSPSPPPYIMPPYEDHHSNPMNNNNNNRHHNINNNDLYHHNNNDPYYSSHNVNLNDYDNSLSSGPQNHHHHDYKRAHLMDEESEMLYNRHFSSPDTYIHQHQMLNNNSKFDNYDPELRSQHQYINNNNKHFGEFSTTEIELFNLHFSNTLSSVKQNSFVIYGWDLSSFAHFLNSIQQESLLRIEITNNTLLRLFSISIDDPKASRIPLANENITKHKFKPDKYGKYHTKYTNAISCWEYFYQALECIYYYTATNPNSYVIIILKFILSLFNLFFF